MDLNQDFLNQKEKHDPYKKPDPKPLPSSSPPPKKEDKRNQKPPLKLTAEQLRKVGEKQAFVKKLLLSKGYTQKELEDYSVYNEGTDYDRECLKATNYFKVMNGEKFISVPVLDIYFWHWFDPKCFERAESYQHLRKVEKEILEKRRIMEGGAVKTEPQESEPIPMVETKPHIVENTPEVIETKDVILEPEIPEPPAEITPSKPVIPEKKGKPKKDEGQIGLF